VVEYGLGRFGLSNVLEFKVQSHLEVKTFDFGQEILEVINLGGERGGPSSRPKMLITVWFKDCAHSINIFLYAHSLIQLGFAKRVV